MASTTMQTTGANGGPTSILGCTVGLLDEANHVASLRIRGTLCAATAREHARQLDELVDQGYTDVNLELEGLLLCTSDGLDLWDEVQHRLDPVSGRLTLSGASGVVGRVLQVVIDSPMHFCPTVVAAA